jgi:hypothetical protein
MIIIEIFFEQSMTEFSFTAKAQIKYSIELLSSLRPLRPLRLCGELKIRMDVTGRKNQTH